MKRLGGGFVELASETERRVLSGLEAAVIAVFEVEQERTAAAEKIAAQGRWSLEEAHYGIVRMTQRGYLTAAAAAGSSLPAWEQEFWRAAGIEEASAAKRVAEAVVALHGPRELREALAHWRIRIAEGPEDPATVALVAVDDYLDAAVLEAANRKALASGRPWMLAKLSGRVAWIGPAFEPGSTACWRCLADRLVENRPTAQVSPGGTPSPQAVAASAGLVANEFVRWVGRGGGGWMAGRLLTFDTARYRTETHGVRQRPRCEACGTGSAVGVGPIAFDLQSPAASGPLEATAERLRSLVSPLTGVIPESRKLSSVGPLHVFFGRVNGALHSKANAAAAGRNDFWQAIGKSRDPLRAEVSCLAESVERYSSGFHRGEALVRRRWSDWRAGEAIHPGTVVLFSERQRQQRESWNAGAGRTNQVFPPFREDCEAEWKQVWSVSRQQPVWMAADLCFIDYPFLEGQQFCLGDSNGCAAGQTKGDAFARGLLELAERDAVAIWWYNRLLRPAAAVAPDAEVHEMLAGRGRTLEILDITNDLGVPTAVAVSWRAGTEDQILLGFGADWSLARAAEKAVEELCVMLLWPGEQIAGSDWKRWWKSARVEPWLRPCGGGRAEVGTSTSPELLGARLASLGLEMIACDLTREDAKLPVVRAIVPGLRHFHAQLGPGRLYDVPVKLGWLDRATAEADLNPMLFPL